MPEYIEREATVELLRRIGSRDYRREKGTVQDAIKMVSCPEYTPSANVATVRHGRWEARAIPRSDPDGDWIALEYHCSLCNRLEYRKENYCPNCGAKMDGVDNE